MPARRLACRRKTGSDCRNIYHSPISIKPSVVYVVTHSTLLILLISGGKSDRVQHCFERCLCNTSGASRRVDCNDRGLVKLPIVEEQYSEASEVDFSDNVLETVDNIAFKNLSRLKHVLLRSNYIESVSTTAFNLTGVKVSPLRLLDFTDNLLHMVPPCLMYLDQYSTNMHNLTDILLAGNEIGSLIESHSFSSTRYLRTIDLSRNRIEIVQERTWRYLPQLNSVNLEFNNLKYISPNVFGRNTPLQTLKLTGNQFATVPLVMPPSLKELLLGQNQITNFSSSDVVALQALVNLEILNMSRNSMRELASEAFLFMPKLRVLDLSINNLVSLQSDTFAGAKGLKYLFLNRNPFLLWLPENIFTRLQNLQYLFLYGCSLRTLSIGNASVDPLSSSFSSSANSNTVEINPNYAPNLKVIWLFGNPINCDCKLLPLIWFVNQRKIELDGSYENFTNPQISDETIVRHFHNIMVPVTSTTCITPSNRRHSVIGKSLLDVPERHLICPWQHFYVVISVCMGLFLFIIAVPVVFVSVFLYLCTLRCLSKYCGLSLVEDED